MYVVEDVRLTGTPMEMCVAVDVCCGGRNGDVAVEDARRTDDDEAGADAVDADLRGWRSAVREESRRRRAQDGDCDGEDASTYTPRRSRCETAMGC